MPAPLYAYPTNALATGPDGTVHLVVEWYKTWPAEGAAEGPAGRRGYASDARNAKERPRSLGVSHLEMPRPGEWLHTDGRKVEKYPVTMEETPLIVNRPEGNPRPGNVAVLPDGRPVFGIWDQDSGTMVLSVRQADRVWRLTDLTASAQSFDPGRHFCSQPQVAVNARGEILLAAARAETPEWGHVSSRIHAFGIAPDSGAITRHEAVPKTDPQEPDWLPNIEKPGPGLYPEELHLVFQTGRRGAKNDDHTPCAVKWTVLR